jgi:hypothetical protein
MVIWEKEETPQGKKKKKHSHAIAMLSLNHISG